MSRKSVATCYWFHKFYFVSMHVNTSHLSQVHDWHYIHLVNMLCKPYARVYKCLVSNSIDLCLKYYNIQNNLKSVDFWRIVLHILLYDIQKQNAISKSSKLSLRTPDVWIQLEVENTVSKFFVWFLARFCGLFQLNRHQRNSQH